MVTARMVCVCPLSLVFLKVEVRHALVAVPEHELPCLVCLAIIVWKSIHCRTEVLVLDVRIDTLEGDRTAFLELPCRRCMPSLSYSWHGWCIRSLSSLVSVIQHLPDGEVIIVEEVRLGADGELRLEREERQGPCPVMWCAVESRAWLLIFVFR